MDKATTTNYSEVIDHYFSGKLGGIAHNHIVANHAVVCHMSICHQQGVGTHHGLAFGCSATVHGGALAQSGAVADDSDSLLAVEFEVLRNSTDHSTGKYCDIAANAGTRENGDVTSDFATFTNLDIGVDGGERSYFDICGNFGVGMYASQLMNHFYACVRGLSLQP